VPEIHFKTSDRAVSFPDGDDVNLLRVAIRYECGLPWRCASGGTSQNQGNSELVFILGQRSGCVKFFCVPLLCLHVMEFDVTAPFVVP